MAGRSRASSAVSAGGRSLRTDGFQTPPEEQEENAVPIGINSAYGAQPVFASGASIRTARSFDGSEADLPLAGDLGDGDSGTEVNASIMAIKSTIAGSVHHRDEPCVHSKQFYRWRLAIVWSLIVGYAGYYLNRSNLSVTQQAIGDETGVSDDQFSFMLSVGYMVYAVGKLFSGVAVDYLGGRLLFIGGLCFSGVFTLAFTFFDSIGGFTAMWCLNRIAQSVGWGALVKVVSCWFDHHEYGRIMGLMSLSYMLGDAVIRIVFGLILGAGVTWKELFYICAAIAGAMSIALLYTLKGSPLDIGEPEPVSNAANVFAQRGESADDAVNHGSVLALLMPIFKSLKFWVLILMSAVLTLIREVFNAWLPTYLENVLGLDPANAAYASAVFPAAGTVSALLGGYLVDRVGPKERGGVPIVFLLILTVTLLGMSAFNYTLGGSEADSLAIGLTLVALVGLSLLAPYSFVDGIFVMNLTGKRGNASAGVSTYRCCIASMINAAGYVGSIISPLIVARFVDDTAVEVDPKEWSKVFIFLAGTALFITLANGLYWYLDVRDETRAAQAAQHDAEERQSLLSTTKSAEV